MNADTLKQLEVEAQHPPGVAARIESTDLKRLLEERARFLYTIERVKTLLLPGYADLDRASALLQQALFFANDASEIPGPELKSMTLAEFADTARKP